MSAAPLLLEDFGQFAGLVPLSVIDGERLEAEKLAAFDKGYTAGWDDASEAHRAETEKAERALAARMDELGFTYHEARAHVMKSLHPLLTRIVDTIVPQVLHDTMGHRLAEALETLADEQPDPEVTLHACPEDVAGLTDFLSTTARFPTRVVSDDTLSAGLIQMRLGTGAQEIDLNVIQQTLADALSALDTLNEDTLSHG